MKHSCLGVCALVCLAVPGARGADKPAAGGPVFNRVRYFPAPDHEAAMVGGKFTGSNVSALEGYQVLAEIKAAPPAGVWTELTLPNEKLFRWIRYEAPPGSHGNVAEIEFYSGPKKLGGAPFGSPGERAGRSWRRALDGDVKTWFDYDAADDQYVGLDLGEIATPGTPGLDPGPAKGEEDKPLKVAMKCRTPDAAIRYTLDGTVPGPGDGCSTPRPLGRQDHHPDGRLVQGRHGPQPAGLGHLPVRRNRPAGTEHLPHRQQPHRHDRPVRGVRPDGRPRASRITSSPRAAP